MRFLISPYKKADGSICVCRSLSRGRIGVLHSVLNQAFEQYVFDRVGDILSLAGVTDEKYRKAVKEADAVLSQLMELARGLEAQQPEMLQLIMEYEAVTTLEAGLAAEIVYREGLRDSCSLRQKLAAFMQQPR